MKYVDLSHIVAFVLGIVLAAWVKMLVAQVRGKAGV